MTAFLETLYLLTITSKKLHYLYVWIPIFLLKSTFLLCSCTFLIVFFQMSPLLDVKNTLALSILWNLVIACSSLNKSAKSSWHNSTQISPTLGAYSTSRLWSGGVGLKNCFSSLDSNHCNGISASYSLLTYYCWFCVLK